MFLLQLCFQSFIFIPASITSSPIAEEANELGETLHRIIDSMITTAPPLTSLKECQETTSKLSRDNTDISVEDLSVDQCTDSDYNIDILEDKNVETAVESHSASEQHEQIINDISNMDIINELKPFNSTTELEKLENALYNQISGAFQKRLRIKNLTLTPKQSMQPVFLLQSGDAGSLLVKSTVSSLKMNKCDDSLHDLKAVSLSNSHLNWNFAQIPMQIATVGYAFPLFHPDLGSKLDLKSLNVSRTSISEHGFVKKSKSDKISQCFKGVHQEQIFEHAAQVDVEEIVAASKVISGTEEIVTKTTERLLGVLPAKELPKDVAEPLPNIPEEKLPVVVNVKNNLDKQEPSPSPDNVDYTTSLDMLVGLLNEIQKITCQKPGNEHIHCTELETILSNAAAIECDRPHDIVSMTSLDKLRHLESNPSLYSFYISSEGSPSTGCIVTEPEASKPVLVDKEVTVNLSEKDLVHTFTDVPSLIPIRVNHSTNVTNSLIGVISEPSNQSMISFNDYHMLYSNTFFSSQSIKRIIELPRVESSEKLKELKKTDLNEKCCEIASPTFEIQRILEEKRSVVLHKSKKYSIKEIDLCSAEKIKRDILVTVYSILVFTVFAALSLPEMAYEG